MEWVLAIGGILGGGGLVALINAIAGKRKLAAEAARLDAESKKLDAESKKVDAEAAKARADAAEVIERVAAAQAERIDKANAARFAAMEKRIDQQGHEIADLRSEVASGRERGQLKIAYIRVLLQHINAGKPPPPPDPPAELLSLWGPSIPILD